MINNIITVDLGSEGDPTAIGVMARHQKFRDKVSLPGTHGWKTEPQKILDEKHIILLERPKLKTPYRDIALRVKQISQHERLLDDCVILLDMTGVGIGVIQIFNEEDLFPIGITITSGHQVNKTDQGFTVPKRVLVTALQSDFQTGVLKIADNLKERDQFLHEARNFKMKLTKKGNETFEAWRDSDHDDIVMAIAQASWYSGLIWTGDEILEETEQQEDYDPMNY